MNRILSACALAAAFASLSVVAGCNSAQFSEAPAQDAGQQCSTYSPIIEDTATQRPCDAGGPPSVNACTADPTSSDTVVARIPAGNYPVNCQVQFYFTAYGGGCSPADNPCVCLAGDGGPDGSAQAQWSNCQDAGLNVP
jgi:hypothetical protein